MEENEERDNGTAINISEVLHTTLMRWPWIILSVVFCVSLALLYVLRTEPTYTRNAELVLRQDGKGKSLGALSDFADMGLMSTRTNLTDEVNKFQSPDIMADVVRRLKLDVSYYTEGTFHNNILYGATLPLTVEMPGLTETEAASFTLEVSPKGQVSITDMTKDIETYPDFKATGKKLGEAISTPIGEVTVNKTAFYRPGEAYRILVRKSTVQGAAGSFSGKVTIAQKDKEGNTITITANDQSTQRAEDLINAIIDVYNERWIENRNKIAVATSAFITERLSRIEAELGNVDRDISSYQSAHLIPDVQQAAQLYMNQNQTVQNEMLNISNQLQMTRYVRQYLVNDNNSKKLLPANSGVGSASIERQIEGYNTLLLQRDQLASQSSPNHPRIMELDASLGAMRNNILQAVDNQIKALDTQIRNLQSKQSQTTARIAASPNQAKYLLSVERQQKVKEALYVFLLQKREETELSQAFTAYNTDVIKMPLGAPSPTSPKRGRILLCAFILGLLLPFGVTYLLELTNTKLRGRQDLDDLGIPLLGEIPRDKSAGKNGQQDGQVVVKQGKRNLINEAFRLMRTSVGFMSAADKPCSVIMVTSFNPGSGKTFITMNLGISLALKGQKTLVIDCDLRRASASVYTNKPSHGITDYLVGKTKDYNSLLVCNSIVDNLCVLPVGVVPPNPTELLESDRFKELINLLRQEFDYILIDCPPIAMMADAQIVNGVCDRTIFVLRAGLLERRMLPELKRMVNDKSFKNMGVVLNGTIPEGITYRYGYGKGYSYGYQYDNYNIED